jgi:muramoyltetrapeptide carboxypeptidase LdcA involved in peptidoglycan recycling
MSRKEKRKKEDEIYKLLGRILLKKERRSQFPIVQNLMCGLIHTHTSFAFALPTIP